MIVDSTISNHTLLASLLSGGNTSCLLGWSWLSKQPSPAMAVLKVKMLLVVAAEDNDLLLPAVFSNFLYSLIFVCFLLPLSSFSLRTRSTLQTSLRMCINWMEWGEVVPVNDRTGCASINVKCVSRVSWFTLANVGFSRRKIIDYFSSIGLTSLMSFIRLLEDRHPYCQETKSISRIHRRLLTLAESRHFEVESIGDILLFSSKFSRNIRLIDRLNNRIVQIGAHLSWETTGWTFSGRNLLSNVTIERLCVLLVSIFWSCPICLSFILRRSPSFSRLVLNWAFMKEPSRPGDLRCWRTS